MLLGTREVWQSTDRTSGSCADGSGSRRRAAEFVVRPDDFKHLDTGEAVVWTTLGPPPQQVTTTPGPTLPRGTADARAVYRPIRYGTLADVLEPPEHTEVPPQSGPAFDLFRG
jgi:hypothetical protein